MTQNNEIVNKLRSTKLRPTKQRIRIAEFLFKREKTFHFTVEKLNKIINKKDNSEKVSLATIYNTIDAFKKAGHVKEILTNNNTSYFDTNVSSHHHFYDDETNELINDKLMKAKLLEISTGSGDCEIDNNGNGCIRFSDFDFQKFCKDNGKKVMINYKF
jgi:Fur family iron response transcriptional regulator